MKLLVFFLVTVAAHAQLALSVINSDGTENRVNAVYGFGQIAAGDTKSIQFRVRNAGSTEMSLSALSLIASQNSGANPFSIPSLPSLPVSLGAAKTLDFSVQFTSSVTNSYSATLIINSQSVILLASAVATPVLSVASPCQVSSATAAITFSGNACTFTLQNPVAQPFPVSPIAVTGTALSGLPSNFANGVTLPASQSTTFTLNYASGNAIGGTLLVGPKTYTINSAAAVTGGPLTLSVISTDGTEQALSGSYDYGSIAAGDNRDVHFRARNTGTTSTQLTSLKVTAGSGFALLNAPTISSLQPYTLAVPPSPSDHLDFWVRFSNAIFGTYIATVSVNSQSFDVSATAVAAATLSVAPPCAGPDPSNTISFGRIQQGSQASCVFTLTNPTSQPLIVSPISLSGAVFTGVDAGSLPLSANQSLKNTITFTATLPQLYTETLVLGPRTYTLTGTGFSAPIAKPNVSFDGSTIRNGEQHTLTISLPTPASVSTSGTVTLAFKPQTTTVTDDAAVQFVATSKRVASLAFTAGNTTVTINGQPNIVFSTGTTAGQITFTLSDGIYGFAGDPTTVITLQPAVMSVTSASATRKLGELDLAVRGFDNTYTAGAMTFRFFDKNGGAVGSLVNADFTSNFQKFYQGQTSGSAFLMGIAFPVVGDSSVVTAVEMTLKNSSGTTAPARLNFP